MRKSNEFNLHILNQIKTQLPQSGHDKDDFKFRKSAPVICQRSILLAVAARLSSFLVA